MKLSFRPEFTNKFVASKSPCPTCASHAHTALTFFGSSKASAVYRQRALGQAICRLMSFIITLGSPSLRLCRRRLITSRAHRERAERCCVVTVTMNCSKACDVCSLNVMLHRTS